VENKDKKKQEMNLKDMLDRAVAAHQSGKFNEARIQYEKLLDGDPENPDALYLLGGIYYQGNNPRLAAELISQAIQSAPDRDYFYNHLGLALNSMGNMDDAMDAFQTALAINAENPETYNMMGKVLKAKGKTSEAIVAFRQAVELDPEYIDACHNLGGELLKQNQPEEAIFVFKQLLDHKPHMVETLNRLGKALLFLDRIPEAIKTFKKCIQADPENAQAYQNLGAAFELAGNQNKAADAFQKAILFAPDSAEAHHRFGNYLLARKKMAEALVEFEKALKKRPEFPEAYNSLGIALKSEGRLEEAIDAYKKSIELNPNHPQTFNNLAVALNAAGKNQEAFEAYRTAISLEPNNPYVFQNIGILLKTQGKLQEALMAFQQAVTLFPEYADAYHNIGSILIEMGRTDQALLALQKAAQIDPGNLSAKYMTAALSGENPKSVPPEYVKELFNQYSNRFDKHLTGQLSYQTPQHLRKALDDTIRMHKKFDKVLDIGCGTGLAGGIFRDLAGHMVGVDISREMICAAEKKSIYNQLHVSEINDFLFNCRENFDLVVAADVFVYFGDLEPLFSCLEKRFNQEAYFLFSIESCPDEDYILHSTGRFAHGTNYIKSLAEKHHFKVVAVNPVVLRKENEQSVKGEIFILLKQADE
jgi:predicted TPR repeat methyltransferase